VEAAAPAARIGRHQSLCRIDQREALEQIHCDSTRILEVAQPGDQHEVLPPAEDLVDGRELPGKANGLAHARRPRVDIEAVDTGCPGVRLEERGQNLHDRRLARAIRAEQGENTALATSRSTPRINLELLVRLRQALRVDPPIRLFVITASRPFWYLLRRSA